MINNYPIITLCGSTRFKGYDFENFVANILNAMGYRTKVSKQGGDSGIGIVAYKDEFPPRICVQVKSIDKQRQLTFNLLWSLFTGRTKLFFPE